MREKAVGTIVELELLRKQGTHSEDEIAERLGFEGGYGGSSAEAMRTQLRNWGLPEWLICPGTLPKGSGRAGEKNTTKAPVKNHRARNGETQRKARRSGQASPLPSASEAQELFREDLQALTDHVNHLELWWEHRQGERFVGARLSHEDDLDSEYFDRTAFYQYPLGEPKGEFLEEEWERVCERYGVDPSVEGFEAKIRPAPSPLGASHLPRGGLADLIAVHALLRRSIDPLIEILHPEPASANRESIKKHANRMRVEADKLARELRGSDVRRGHHPGEVSQLEMWLAWHIIGPRRQKGVGDERILQELREFGFYMEGAYEPGEEGDRLALGEIRRIASLGLEMPED